MKGAYAVFSSERCHLSWFDRNYEAGSCKADELRLEGMDAENTEWVAEFDGSRSLKTSCIVNFLWLEFIWVQDWFQIPWTISKSRVDSRQTAENSPVDIGLTHFQGFGLDGSSARDQTSRPCFSIFGTGSEPGKKFLSGPGKMHWLSALAICSAAFLGPDKKSDRSRSQKVGLDQLKDPSGPLGHVPVPDHNALSIFQTPHFLVDYDTGSINCRPRKASKSPAPQPPLTSLPQKALSYHKLSS